MVDSEITILIKAVDEMTGTLKKIEGQLVDSNKNIKKNTEKTTQAFDKQMGSVLVLGQAVGSVNHIMDSYENLQLRLENASERVASAQDRLADAQSNLNKLMKSGSASSEDLTKAQRDVESASRSLTIAQNNQERANNKIFDTYLSMGMQSVVLMQSMKSLKGEIIATTTAVWAFVKTPVGIVLMAVSAATVYLVTNLNKLKKITEEINITTSTLDDLEIQSISLKKELANTTERYAKAISKVRDEQRKMIGATTPEEAKDLRDIAKMEERIAQLKSGQIQPEIKSIEIKEWGTITSYESISALEKELETAKLTYDGKWAASKNYYDSEILLAESTANREKGILKETDTFWKMTENEKVNYLHSQFGPAYTSEIETIYKSETDIIIAELERLNKKIAETQAALDNLYKKQKKASTISTIYKATQAITIPISIIPKLPSFLSPGKEDDFISRPGQKPISFSSSDTIIGTKGGPSFLSPGKEDDFISRPGQKPISFSSSDTIIGTKGGVGNTIIIEGDVYGYDDFKKKVDRALFDNLKTKIGQI